MFSPKKKPFVEFNSSEQINNYLLRDPEVPGDYRFKGADLGILVTKGRMQTADGLTQRCWRYIDGIRSQYTSEKLPETPTVVPIGYVK